MQSTQRVEKMHNLIKREVSSRTPLTDLFAIIESRISDEEHVAAYINYKTDTKTQETITTHRFFSGVDRMNTRFLASFALFRMRKEMNESSFYKASSHIDEEMNNSEKYMDNKDMVS